MRSVFALGLLTMAACAGSTTTVAPGPARSAPALVTSELRRDLAVFASDSFAGRETGTPGAMRAARFLVDRVMSLGLEPAGDSLYLQRVPLIRNTFASGTRLTVTQGASTIPLTIGAEVVPWVNLGVGTPLPRRSA